MDFLTDILGEPYQSIDLPLTADDEGDVVATLVRRRSADPGAAAGGSRRAVLYVHGFVDYGQGQERAVEEERVDRPLPGPPVGLGRLAATRKLPAPLNPHYVHSLHRDFRGSWEFDLALKPAEGFPLYAGWLAAIQRGHRRVRRGLGIDCPVLVMASTASTATTEWGDALLRTDGVLRADDIARLAPRLGPRVTTVRIRDGVHDLVLSIPEVRECIFAELALWLRAYLPDRAG